MVQYDTKLHHRRRCIPHELLVQVHNGHRNVIAEHAHNLLGQRQQMRDLGVLDTVFRAAQRVSNQVGRHVCVKRRYRESVPAKGRI